MLWTSTDHDGLSLIVQISTTILTDDGFSWFCQHFGSQRYLCWLIVNQARGRKVRAPLILNQWLTSEVRDAKAAVKEYLTQWYYQCSTANNKIPIISEIQSVIPPQAAHWIPIWYSPCPCKKDRIRGPRGSPYKVLTRRLVIHESRPSTPSPPDIDEELRPIGLVEPYRKVPVPWYETQIAGVAVSEGYEARRVGFPNSQTKSLSGSWEI